MSVRLDHLVGAADRVELGGVRLRPRAQLVDDAAEQPLGGAVLRVHTPRGALHDVVREERRRQCLRLGAVLFLAHRLDERAHVRHEGALALLVQLADEGQRGVHAEGAARLLVRARGDREQIGLGERGERAHALVLHVERRVRRAALCALRVRHEHVERVRGAGHEEDDDGFVRPVERDLRGRERALRLQQLVVRVGVELRARGEEALRAAQRGGLAFGGELRRVRRLDHRARVRREAAAREEKRQLVDDSRRAGGGGREGEASVGDARAAPRAESVPAAREAALDERRHPVEVRDHQRRRAHLRLGRDERRVGDGAARLVLGEEEGEDARAGVRRLPHRVAHLVQLDLAPVGGVLHRAEEVHHLEQRLAQLAVRPVGVERGRARLAVEQHRGERRRQVAVRS
mmetsp:Transcript_13511/g.32244  ORF Transcript_13511/g.32244 Transcript_13511/m.32244 type:complete len:403 (+) Transcript_13511:1409-2617(+)